MVWTYNTAEGTPTSGPTLAAVVLAFTSAALLVVCLRLYVRACMIKAAGWDDCLIIIAWTGACGYTATTVIQTRWGLGLKSLDDMPPENVFTFSLAQYIGAPFYVTAIWAFKTSLLFSYLRYFYADRRYRMATIGLIVTVAMAHVAFICGFLFPCNPIKKQWDPAVTGGHCFAQVPFYLTFSALTILFDVMVMALPLPALFGIRIQRRKKIILLCLFTLGIFVTIIQIIRIQTISSLSNYLDSVKPIVCSIIEADIGIIISSVPTLAPLVKSLREKSRSGGTESAKTRSRYAMHTWPRAGDGGSALQKAGAHGAAAGSNCSSTENILVPASIVKRVDVVVTSQQAGGSGMRGQQGQIGAAGTR